MSERKWTLSASQLIATVDMIAYMSANKDVPLLVKEGVPAEIRDLLTQHVSVAQLVVGIAAPSQGGKAVVEGKKKRKKEEGAAPRGLTLYNLYTQRVQSAAELHKEHPIFKAVNPDGTKKPMTWLGEIWSKMPATKKEQLINDTKELLKVLNLFREKHGSRRDPNNVGAVSLIAAYEVLNPKKTLPELMGLTTGEYTAAKLRLPIQVDELAAAVKLYKELKDVPVVAKEPAAKKAKKEAPAAAPTPTPAPALNGAANGEAKPKKDKKKDKAAAAPVPEPEPVVVEEKKKSKKKDKAVAAPAPEPEPEPEPKKDKKKKKKDKKKDEDSE